LKISTDFVFKKELSQICGLAALQITNERFIIIS